MIDHAENRDERKNWNIKKERKKEGQKERNLLAES